MSLYSLYLNMLELLGHQHWWPAESPFEVMVGAILTQQTRWENVERAVGCLKQKGLMSPEMLALKDVPEETAVELAPPSSWYHIWVAPEADALRGTLLVVYVVEVGEVMMTTGMVEPSFMSQASVSPTPYELVLPATMYPSAVLWMALASSELAPPNVLFHCSVPDASVFITHASMSPAPYESVLPATMYPPAVWCTS